MPLSRFVYDPWELPPEQRRTTFVGREPILERLLAAIRELRSGGAPMSNHIARKVVQAFQPAEGGAPPMEPLAPREVEVLNLLSQGCAYKQIAAQMEVSESTIRTYIGRIYHKLHVNCRTQAVVKYLDAAGSGPRRRLFF